MSGNDRMSDIPERPSRTGPVVGHGRAWIPDRPAGAVLLLHGSESHSGWFDELGPLIARAGLAAIAHDRPGWGCAPGRRGWMPSYAETLRQLAENAADARQRFGSAHLAGLSWGGLFGLYAALRRGPLFDSLTMIAPGLVARGPAAWRLPALGLAWAAGRMESQVPLPFRPEDFTRRPDRRAFVRDDPLRLTRVSLAFAAETVKMRRFIAETAGRRRIVPAQCLLAGADNIVDNARTRALTEAAGARTVVYEGASHSLVFEDPARVADDIVHLVRRAGLAAESRRGLWSRDPAAESPPAAKAEEAPSSVSTGKTDATAAGEDKANAGRKNAVAEAEAEAKSATAARAESRPSFCAPETRPCFRPKTPACLGLAPCLFRDAYARAEKAGGIDEASRRAGQHDGEADNQTAKGISEAGSAAASATPATPIGRPDGSEGSGLLNPSSRWTARSPCVVVMGAGAVGSMVGGLLALGGVPTALVARGAHARAINGGGLRLFLDGGERTVRRAIVAVEDPADAPREPALAILAVKGFDTPAALKDMRAFVGPRTVIASLQNGLGNEALIARAFPENPLVAGAIGAYLSFDGPGRVAWADDKGGLAGAPAHGDADAARDIWQTLMPATGLECQWHDDPAGEIINENANADVNVNARGAGPEGINEDAPERWLWTPSAAASVKWSKLMLNVAFNALNAVTGWPVGRALAHPLYGRLAALALREGFACMRRLGIETVDMPGYPLRLLARVSRLPTGPLRALLAWAMAREKGGTSSMRHDLARARNSPSPATPGAPRAAAPRRRTEVDAINGEVARAGAALGMDCPANRRLASMVEASLNWRASPDQSR